MGIKDKAVRIAIRKGIEYIRKDFDNNSLEILNKLDKLNSDPLYGKMLKRLIEVISKKPHNAFVDFLEYFITTTDIDVIMKLIDPVMNVIPNSYDRRRAAMEKYGCNIPWGILVDPTAACNKKCVGCWAAEYGKSSQLSNDVLRKIIREGKELGTYAYLYTGGEPLMRKKDLIMLCEENPDCLFLTFTNASLCDDAFADELKRVGNMILTFSIEGSEETTDARRGAGTYKEVTSAMARLKSRGIPFGASICYTKENVPVLGSDEYADFLVEQGCMFAWYFAFMPVGGGASSELMVTAEQREFMYHQIRKWRYSKPFFPIDFFNDGEYVNGCIAAGKQYFHINSSGDCEPCVFAHYSSVNINNQSLLDALQSPLFMAYRNHQPFSDNMLRPCPVLDNPGAIKKMVHDTGAHSTDLMHPESVDDLFAKTVESAKLWKPVADRLAEEYGFVKKHIRSVDVYVGYESEKLRDFEEFE